MPVENLLTIASGGTGLSYDPELRLYEVAGGGAATRFAYDGLNAIAEYNGSNALQRRYVFDDRGNPVIWYEGADLSQRRFLAVGELGSVITVTDGAANAIAIDTYDEYGIPSATNIGRFQYTGQMWIGEAGMYAPTYRALFAHLGRYGQTDPMGYGGDGPNLYAYVLNDPVNRTDPLGLSPCSINGVGANDILVCGRRLVREGSPLSPNVQGGGNPNGSMHGGGGDGGSDQDQTNKQCTLTPTERVIERAASYSDYAAVGTGLATAVSAPTGAGALFFGSITAGLKISSGLFTVALAVSEYSRGERQGATAAIAGLAVGALAPLGILKGISSLPNTTLVRGSKAIIDAEGIPANISANIALHGCH